MVAEALNSAGGAPACCAGTIVTAGVPMLEVLQRRGGDRRARRTEVRRALAGDDVSPDEPVAPPRP